ncbi:hypothetical protein [Thomasclavelia sp.]|uniref:hypothetical protein n=1 Tax=Thomasclavelia sp. TaxID=3025757 RepID=UPI0025CC011D|nr:hypothetical protein [Thomasclavelia sp.]
MNPFFDENYNYNNFNPQMYPPNMQFPVNHRIKTRENIKKTIRIASRSIYTINQIIPIVYQIRPIIANTKNAFRVIQAVNHLNDIDFDEVEKSITPIDNENKKPDNDVTFENMVQ